MAETPREAWITGIGIVSCLGEGLDAHWQGFAEHARVIDTAEFAIDVGRLHHRVGERRDGARIFVGPVEARPSEELHAAIVNTRGHAKAVQFDFM